VPTRLVWHGSVCGTAEDFAARVLDRTSAVRFVRKGQRLAVRLRIERHDVGLQASVSIEARGRAPLRRNLESPDCDDALDALALIVAIGIEGHSGPAPAAPASEMTRPLDSVPPPEPPAPPSESAEPPPPEAPPTDLGASASPTARALPELPPAPAALPAPGAPEVDAPAPPSADVSRPLRVAAGISAQLSSGVAPNPLIGGAVWISTGWERDGVWSPELVVSALHQRRDGLSIQGGRVDFGLSAAAASICPLRLGGSVWRVRPCAATVLGRLTTEAHDTYDPRSSDRPWATLGGALELSAAIGVIELRATVGASAPLVRDGFRFGGACTGSACEVDVFHRVAPPIWSGAVGAGIRLW
jgi:hypothetical protein